MGFNCGIVGLPNVGKSTLFNALTATAKAQAANYPFCTIEPNIGRVAVPDERLSVLQKIDNAAKIVPTQLEFVDIAGLVRGASKGEGLGNQFLANIREVDAIIHVVRCFENADVVHVEGSVDPARDIETIETELMLADLEVLDKRIAGVAKKAQSGDKDSRALLAVMQPGYDLLKDGKPARLARPTDAEQNKLFDQLCLLSAKPVLYVCNVEESAAAAGNAFSSQVAEMAAREGNAVVIVSAGIEAEVAQLPADEQGAFLETLGLAETGLNRVIRAGYALLTLETFFTTGPKETHAWTMRRGTSAPQAAGIIHTDFERGFIRAEVVSYADYVAYSGESGAREAGKLRQEGKTYIMKDGDICHFLFNI